jgi:hypothetical protein
MEGSEILLEVNCLNNQDDGMDHRLDSFSWRYERGQSHNRPEV